MKAPDIKEKDIKTIYDNRYVSLYSMDLGGGHIYLEASRRKKEDLLVLKSDEELSDTFPDAVTCILVLKTPGYEPRLYLEHEFRFPAGRFLISPPAGLIDKADLESDNPFITAAKREIYEETGVELKDGDEVKVVSPMFFSSPGMTDESNAIVCATAYLPDLSCLTNINAEATECFNGYSLYTKEEAKKLLEECKDENGQFFSIFTWSILMYFVYMF